jgi:hypothetical protein
VLAPPVPPVLAPPVPPVLAPPVPPALAPPVPPVLAPPVPPALAPPVPPALAPPVPPVSPFPPVLPEPPLASTPPSAPDAPASRASEPSSSPEHPHASPSAIARNNLLACAIRRTLRKPDSVTTPRSTMIRSEATWCQSNFWILLRELRGGLPPKRCGPSLEAKPAWPRSHDPSLPMSAQAKKTSAESAANSDGSGSGTTRRSRGSCGFRLDPRGVRREVIRGEQRGAG